MSDAHGIHLTELRVHGVGGSPPEALLGDPAPTQVAGDRLAGFYRTADTADRHREAYSWGGLTSRARSRALWTLLIPSMLANMAGWTGRMPDADDDTERDRPPTTRPFRAAARLAALGLTLGTSALVTMLTVDVLAYQCGGQPSCVRAGPLTGLVTALAPPDHPGARLAAGGALSGLVALTFHLLARSTRRRYESVEPPTIVDTPTPDRTPRTPAALPGGLRHPDFWAGMRWHEHLSDLHLTAALAVLAAAIAWPARSLHQATVPATPTGAVLADVTVVTAVVLTGVVVGWTCLDDVPPRLTLGPRRRPRLLAARAALAAPSGRARGAALSHLLLWAAVATVLTAGVAAHLAPRAAGATATATVPPGPLLERQGVTRVALTLSLALVAVLVVQQGAAWTRRRHDTRTATFPCGPVVMNAVGMTLAVTVLLGAVLSVADVLGDVRYGLPSEAAPTRSPTLWVAPLVGATASLLGAGLLTVLTVTALGAALVVLRSGRRPADALHDLVVEYRGDRPFPVSDTAPPGSPEAWAWSAFLEPGDPRPPAGAPGLAPNAWVRTLLRRRYLATHSQDLAAWLVVPIAALGALVVVAVAAATLTGTALPPPIELGSRVAALLPVALVAVLQLTFRRQHLRRGVGVAFDVGCFFPRAFHPFAPPSYTERAVPELLRRIWYLQDAGDTVVLLAHSQGSVLAGAALVRPSPQRGSVAGCLGLVTFGSPLGKLYRWAFPALVSDQLLAGLADATTPRAGVGTVRWLNLYYPTDYVGQQIGGAASAALAGTREVRLRDPADHAHVYGQPRPPVVSHVGYWDDQRQFWRRVDALCRDVAQADATARDAARPTAAPGGAAPDLAPPAYQAPADTAWQYRPRPDTR